MTDAITCPGFKAAGIVAGIKKNGKKDLGLLYSEKPAVVAGVFTKNRVKAAPVLLDQERIRSGTCQAVIVNSGNANCCTGDRGMQDAAAMARCAAAGLNIPEEQVLVASTGVIGAPLPIEKIQTSAPDLIRALRSDGLTDFAEAIMTTDTAPKLVTRTGQLGGKPFTVAGTAKGAGMIRPDMATMLCFVLTDVQASPQLLSETLARSVKRSFNRITIDGDTSTNDTVLLLASGRSGLNIDTETGRAVFQQTLDEVLLALAKRVIKDGEGATKLVEVVIQGAPTETDAETVAFTVAHSSLFKTALFGEDANWGRILAAVGRSGVAIDPGRIDIYFDRVMMVKDGMGCGAGAEAEATRVLKKPEFTVTVDLHLGGAAFSVFTCDFSIDYVKINADYRS